MDEGGGSASGGLRELFNMVLGGLVGTTPHMISASVMALARLLYEFAGDLEGVVPQLLPAVLMLLRSKAREVVKSVLGFLKVRSAAQRRGRHAAPPPAGRWALADAPACATAALLPARLL
jgi:hypothetical protein